MTGFDNYKQYLIAEEHKKLEQKVANDTYKGKKDKGWAKKYRQTDAFEEELEKALGRNRTIKNIQNATPDDDIGIYYFSYQDAIDYLLEKHKPIDNCNLEEFYVAKAIKELDLSSIDEYFSKYTNKVIDATTKYFTTKEVGYFKRDYTVDMYGYGYGHGDKTPVPLTENTVGDFIEEYERVQFKYPCLTGISYCKTYFQKHFLPKITKLMPIYIKTPRAIKKFEYGIENLLEDDNSYPARLAQMLTDKFTVFHILELLKSNPHYSKTADNIIEIAHNIATLHADILDTIPEHYPDLYPNSRRLHRHFILHIGGTNSGKTYTAIEALKKAKTGVYLAPLRLLAYEQFDNLNKQGIPCTLLTGEENIEIPMSEHMSSTIEMLNMNKHYDVAVIDEAQMISDKYRGGAWTKAILGVCANEVHICLAKHAKDIITKLIDDCGDTYEIHETERQVPLRYDKCHYEFPKSVQDGDALIVFSRKDVHSVAAELKNKKIPCSVIYGNLPYDVRHKEAEKFNKGETKVVVATDAIGMGLNMPIKRVVFLDTMKFDGEEVRTLLPEEVQQIAGRAGRYGIFNEGLYTQDKSTPVGVKPIYDRVVPQIQTAYISFPTSLIHLNVNLSRILKKWNDIPNNGVYHKANLDREIELCEYLEGFTTNKQLIYDLITIPFSNKEDDIRELWNRYATDIIAGRKSSYKHLLTTNYGKHCTLELLEHDYKVCDLIYYFASKFWGDKAILTEVMETKAVISKLTMEKLDKMAVSFKRCNRCGHKLPWNHKYGICTDCYNAGRRYNYYDYDFDDDDFDIF